MKKIVFLFLSALFTGVNVFSQTTAYVSTPQNVTTTQLRAPNGLSSHAFMRGAALVQTSELTGIPPATSLTVFGFTTTAGANVPVTGTITVYLENTNDATFLKSTTWSTAIAPMTVVYSGTITLPSTAATVDLNLGTSFVYTGNAMYIAYDFVSAGPYATTPVTYGANSSFANSHYSASSPSLAPTTLNLISAFRPTFRFGFANPFSNDVSVEDINSIGNLPFMFGTPHQVKATVRNSGSGTVTGVNVNLNINGANTFVNTQMVSVLSPGASTLITFANWTPGMQGFDTIKVTVPSDQNNSNNQLSFKQKVSCNVLGTAQTPANYSIAIGYNTGSGLILAKFQSPITSTVTGANVAISTNTASGGNPVYAVLVDNAGNILASSNTITIIPSMYGTLQSFTFTPAMPIASSTDYYVGLAQTPNTSLGYFPIGSYASLFIPFNLYYTAALTGGSLSILSSNVGIMGIETVFAGSCVSTSIDQTFSNVSNVLVYPNPANNLLHINLNSKSENAFVEIYNAVGENVMKSTRLNTDSNQINLGFLSGGVYMVRISNGTEISTQRIVIER